MGKSVKKQQKPKQSVKQSPAKGKAKPKGKPTIKGKVGSSAKGKAPVKEEKEKEKKKDQVFRKEFAEWWKEKKKDPEWWKEKEVWGHSGVGNQFLSNLGEKRDLVVPVSIRPVLDGEWSFGKQVETFGALSGWENAFILKARERWLENTKDDKEAIPPFWYIVEFGKRHIYDLSAEHLLSEFVMSSRERKFKKDKEKGVMNLKTGVSGSWFGWKDNRALVMNAPGGEPFQATSGIIMDGRAALRDVQKMHKGEYPLNGYEQQRVQQIIELAGDKKSPILAMSMAVLLITEGVIAEHGVMAAMAFTRWIKALEKMAMSDGDAAGQEPPVSEEQTLGYGKDFFVQNVMPLLVTGALEPMMITEQQEDAELPLRVGVKLHVNHEVTEPAEVKPLNLFNHKFISNNVWRTYMPQPSANTTVTLFPATAAVGYKQVESIQVKVEAREVEVPGGEKAMVFTTKNEMEEIRESAEEHYIKTSIAVLKYISELEKNAALMKEYLELIKKEKPAADPDSTGPQPQRPEEPAEQEKEQDDAGKDVFVIPEGVYQVKPEDLFGDLDGFPIQVAQMMVKRQFEQTGKCDVKVFQEYNKIDASRGGFTWHDAPERKDFWSCVIDDHDFELFFKRYPSPSGPSTTQPPAADALTEEKTSPVTANPGTASEQNDQNETDFQGDEEARQIWLEEKTKSGLDKDFLDVEDSFCGLKFARTAVGEAEESVYWLTERVKTLREKEQKREKNKSINETLTFLLGLVLGAATIPLSWWLANIITHEESPSKHIAAAIMIALSIGIFFLVFIAIPAARKRALSRRIQKADRKLAEARVKLNRETYNLHEKVTDCRSSIMYYADQQ